MLRNLLTKLHGISGKRRKWLRTAGILIICVLFFESCTQSASREELNHVGMSVWSGNRLYGVECFAKKNTVFSCDEDGKNRKKIVFDMSGPDEIRIAESVFMGEDGLCYVLYQAYSQIDQIKYVMAACNFEQGILESPREIPLSDYLDLAQHTSRHFTDGTTWYVDPDGSVWTENKEGVKKCLFLNDGKKMDLANTAYCFGIDSLYFYHVENGIIYGIPYETGVLEETELGNLTQGMEGSLYRLNQMEQGSFTAGFRDEDGRLLPAVLKEGSGLIEALYPPLAEQVKHVAGRSAILLGGILLLYLIYKGISCYFGNIIPTPLKLFCYATLIVIVGSRVVTLTTLSFLQNQMMEKEAIRVREDTNTLAEMVRSWVGETTNEPMYVRFVEDLNEYANITMSSGDIFDTEKQSLGGISNIEINYDLLLKYNEDYYLVNEKSRYCEPPAYVFGKRAADYMKESEEEKGALIFYGRDPQWGNNLIVYRPIMDDAGNVYGLIRGMVNESILEERVQEAKDSIIKWVNLFLGVTLTLLTVITGVIMWPLIKLTHYADSVEPGIDGGWKKKRGVSEVAQITHVFVQMLESIDVHLKKIRKIKQAYEPFVPENIIGMFGGKDIIDIQLGEKTTISAVILVLESEELKKKKDGKDGESQFQILNQMYCLINENIEKAGGIVERFTEAGAVIIFHSERDSKGIKEIFQAAAETQEKLNAAHIEYGGTVCYFGGGMAVGEIQLGIVGTEERMEVMVVSPHTGSAFELERISCKYRAGILMVKQAAREAEKAGESDLIRQFGYWGMTEARTINKEVSEDIYEYFASMGMEQIKLRAVTRGDYEAGIQYLKAEKFREARSSFEQVLRQNRDDLGVKSLFRLCDKKMQELSSYKEQ